MYMEYHSPNAGLMFSQEWQNYSLHRSIDVHVQCTYSTGTTQKENDHIIEVYWVYTTQNIIIIIIS